MIPPDMMQRLVQWDEERKAGIREICRKDLTVEQEEQELLRLTADYGAKLRGLTVEVLAGDGQKVERVEESAY